MITRRFSEPANKVRAGARLASLILLGLASQIAIAASLFQTEKFTTDDAILVSDQQGNVVYQWQPERALIPASVAKLVTASLAIDKWGLDHRFETGFYLRGSTLWVKGFGDPYLISEELDRIAAVLRDKLPINVSALNIDASYFADEAVPARSMADDPYNAPLSAVAANFNTVKLQRQAGRLVSAEPQTPITDVAIQLADSVGSRAVRVNLKDSSLAQKYFGELLLLKLGLNPVEITINQILPPDAELVYRHQNSHTLADVLRGTLEYSNNFIANQLFLLLPEEPKLRQMNFAVSRQYAEKKMASQMGWSGVKLVDGSGLSRDNRLSAQQINQVLTRFKPHMELLKRYPLVDTGKPVMSAAAAFAKSGTLDGVHSFAGFLELAGRQFQFVFVFNRKMPYRYRETLLQQLADQLAGQVDRD